MTWSELLADVWGKNLEGHQQKSIIKPLPGWQIWLEASQIQNPSHTASYVQESYISMEMNNQGQRVQHDFDFFWYLFLILKYICVF